MLGAWPAMGLEAARREARRALVAVDAGGDPASEEKARVKERRAAPTFAELANDWFERHSKPNKSAHASADDRGMLDRHILPEIGERKAFEIKKRDVLELLDIVAAKADARKGAKPHKLSHRPNRVFEVVRAIFRWALRRDLLQYDPTHGLQRPIKKEAPRERTLAPAEVHALWRALDGAPLAKPARRTPGDFPMIRPTALAILLALTTAQRIGEVTGIAMSELTLKGLAPLWVIPGARTKNREPNRVLLSALAVRLIQEARELSDGSLWLFPSPKGDGPIDSGAPKRALDRARPALGLAHFRIHDLRRTAATGMAELGVNPHVISHVLNHISATKGSITSLVYNRYAYDKEKREALELWGEWLAKLVS